MPKQVGSEGKDDQLNVRVDPRLRQALKIVAISEFNTVNGLVVSILEGWFESKGLDWGMIGKV